MPRGRKPKIIEGAVTGVYEQKGKNGSTWTARYWSSGADVRRVFKTQALAIEHLEKVRLMRLTGERIPTTAKVPLLTSSELEKRGSVSNLLLSDLIDEYMSKQKETAEREEVQNSKKIGYVTKPLVRIDNLESRFKRIRKAFVGRYADSIEPHEVKDFLESLQRSNGTMNRYKTTLSGVYEYAIERKKLKVNPTNDVEHYPAPLGIPRWMDDDEETRIRKVVQSWINETPKEHEMTRLLLAEHLNEVTVASQTGMRKGNQYALMWDLDINFELRLILLPNTKTGKPHVIPMTESVYEALKDQQRIQERLRKLRGDDYESGRLRLDGRVFTIRENREWFAKAKKDAGIKTNLRWHDLSRHTAGSRLAASGANQKVIQTVLGHSSIAMSARYTHLTRGHIAEAMKALDRTTSGTPLQ